jgi:ABC-type uncharacterized transport system fused permease/ATPase subunit
MKIEDKVNILTLLLKLASSSLTPENIANNAGSSSLLIVSCLLIRRLSKKSDGKTKRENEISSSKDGTKTKCIKFALSLMGVKESCLGAGLVVTLVLRVYCELKLIHLTTAVENSIVTLKSEASFLKNLRSFSFYILPASALYSIYHFIIDELSISLRDKLSTRLISKYTSGNCYYRVSQGFTLSDQIITQDVDEYTTALTALMSHVIKPTVDIVVKFRTLWSKAGGPVAPAAMAACCTVASVLVNYVRIPASNFTSEEQELEGEFRKSINGLNSNAEEIASLNGGPIEERFSMRNLTKLLQHSRLFAQFKCLSAFTDSVIAKYWMVIIGFRIISSRFLSSDSSGNGSEMNEADSQRRYSSYQNMSKIMLSLNASILALSLSGTDSSTGIIRERSRKYWP